MERRRSYIVCVMIDTWYSFVAGGWLLCVLTEGRKDGVHSVGEYKMVDHAYLKDNFQTLYPVWVLVLEGRFTDLRCILRIFVL